MYGSVYRFHKFDNNDAMKLSQSINYNAMSLPTSFVATKSFNNSTNNPFTKNTQPQTFLNSSKYSFSSEDPFPFKEIISLDFLKIIKVGDPRIIEKYLPKMLYQKFKSADNSHLALLITKFQQVLNYLFQLQETVNSQNIQLEQNANDTRSPINIRKSRIEGTYSDNQCIIAQNELRINELRKRSLVYKSIIYSNGYQEMLPTNLGPYDLHDDLGNFYCQICPKRKFKTYDQVHAHYVKKHFNLEKSKCFNFRSGNNSFEKFYFENKLQMMKDELKSTIISYCGSRNDENEAKRYEDLKDHVDKIAKMNSDYNNLKNLNSSRVNYSRINIRESGASGLGGSMNNDEIKEYISKVKAQQEEQFNQFNQDFNEFKREIFSQLSNLSQGKKINIPASSKNYYIFREGTEEKHSKLGGDKKSIDVTVGSKYDKPLNFNDDRTEKEIEFEKEKIEILSPKSRSVVSKGEHFERVSRLNKSSNMHSETVSQQVPQVMVDPKEFPSVPEKIEKKNLKQDLLQKLFNAYQKRESGILFNPVFEEPKEVAKNYNFLRLNAGMNNRATNYKVKEAAKKYDFDVSESEDYLSKKHYEDLIKRILKGGIQKSEKDLVYAKYKDNILAMNKIEDMILDTDSHDRIFDKLNVDKAFDFLGCTEKHQ